MSDTDTADLLALLDTDPAEGLRQTADHAGGDAGRMASSLPKEATALRAIAALWRGIAERHVSDEDQYCHQCSDSEREWREHYPCPDLRLAVDAARAYLGGAS